MQQRKRGHLAQALEEKKAKDKRAETSAKVEKALKSKLQYTKES